MRNFLNHILMVIVAVGFTAGCFPVAAQEVGAVLSDDAVLRLTADLGQSNVSFDYTYVMSGGSADLKGGGSLTVQGPCYFIEGDGLRIWCDGSSVWTFDVMEDEVVIESADAVGGFAANPLLTIANCADLYTWAPEGRATTFGGVSCREFTLVPTAKVEFTGVKLYIVSDALVGAVMSMAKNTMTFTITSYKSSPADPESVFIPGTFPEDCIVTDLR